MSDMKCVYIYENQRWNPISGFAPRGLLTDRYMWSDASGLVECTKEGTKLDSVHWHWSEETRQPRPVDSLEPVSQRDVTDGVRWDARLLPPRRELYDRGSVALGESRCAVFPQRALIMTPLESPLACPSGLRYILEREAESSPTVSKRGRGSSLTCNAEQKTEPYEHATALDTGLACAGARLLLCLSVRSCLAAANVRSP
ncbi:hypothetical protein HPB49_023143 [Dermacentor silvarum]|uniref:Uncharacterized protein n=1 Tax=Dermacentor silvarum TaxID=543639 RepID=A0ACB8CTL6_DERSI|nr:hypothetical protein HPB49_023143 [Dermacentor silvarum]